MGGIINGGAWRASSFALAAWVAVILGTSTPSVHAQPAPPKPRTEIQSVDQQAFRFPIRPEPPVTVQQRLMRENWRKSMVARPVPRAGCFTAIFPNPEWRSIPCSPPPLRPFPPARGIRPETVGGSNDFSAQVTGSMTSAEGSFDSITGMTSETNADIQNGGAPTGSNKYTLQVNTNTWTGGRCSGADNPAACTSWEQFVYSNSFGMVIQYWLIKYSMNCPAGFTFYNNSGDLDCYRNGDNGISVGNGNGQIPQQALTNLKNLTLTGSAGQGAVKDSFVFFDGSQTWTDAEDNSILGLHSGWTTAEFNIFGDCCGSQAQFNSGTSIVVRTTVHNGTMNAPSCLSEGFTGETNNLNLVSNPAVGVAPAPAIVFTQSTATGPAACATASSTGDTHLVTFDGVLYDFQAYGDFVLAQSSGFTVQTRQAVAPSTYPGTAVNKGVAVAMGAQRIVLTIEPTTLTVDGAARDLGDGATLAAGPNVFVTRHGNSYFMRDRRGDAVLAAVQPEWIDVTVGLSRTPQATARGLLGNPAGAADTITARDGARLVKPFAFTDLYHHYADSWRVTPRESLFPNPGVAVIGIPQKAIYAADLLPADRAKARALCVARGVTGEGFIDACTLDTAVLKRPEVTARAFLRPTAVVRSEIRVNPQAVARLREFTPEPIR